MIPTYELENIRGQSVRIPDPQSCYVHLQFRRYAGCPVCNLHLQSFAKRIGEIEEAGVREAVVFHSSAKEMQLYQSALPFDTVADPEKKLYRAFGVGASPLSLLNPKVWGAIAAGVVSTRPATVAEGGKTGLPADFLIAPDGRIVALHYGTHADDHWSVDALIALTGDAA